MPSKRSAARAAASRRHIWQLPEWPNFSFDAAAVSPGLQLARLEQGRLLGRALAVGFVEAQELQRDVWMQETVATAAIEGDALDLAAVRSSVCRRLGLAAERSSDRHVEGLVEVMHDALANHADALDADRLCCWQSALFPGGTAGVRRIAVGRYRNHADPMQIVSGLPGREVVHYTAPPSSLAAGEMQRFLVWFSKTRPPQGQSADGITRAALAHLWFETIHPFEDGNGRIGRALVDLALAQDSGSPARLVGLSRQLLETRTGYYDALKAAQCGSLDATAWVQWFTQAFTAACVRSQALLQQALAKSEFWQRAAQVPLNERQRKVLALLIEAGDGGFLGGMTADKYLKITSTSKATATRDLAQLLGAGLLVVEGIGKATRYAVNVQGWNLPR